MEVRTIKENEINLFTSLDNDPKSFEKTVKKLWKDKLSSPNWCFIIKENENIIGRIGFWTPNKNNKSAIIFGLKLINKNNDFIEIGTKLLKDSFNIMKQKGFKYIDSQLDSVDEEFSFNKKLYKNIDMEIIQSKYRFKLVTKNYNYSLNNRLKYKPIKETSKDYFIKILKEVTKKTLDREDKQNIKRHGELKAAEKHFDSLSSIEYSPDNWFLGYNDSKVVGLIIPQLLFDSIGTINYIGVVPKNRGNGFVIDLLDKGIRNLIERDVNEIIADIDTDNKPMKIALNKMGFKEKNSLINYRKNL